MAPMIRPSARNCRFTAAPLHRRCAEIERGDGRIVAKIGGRPVVPVLPFDQDVGAVGDRQRRLDVLLDQQDGDAGRRGSSSKLARRPPPTIFGDRPAEASSSIRSLRLARSARARPPASGAGPRTAARRARRRRRRGPGKSAYISSIRAARSRGGRIAAARREIVGRPTCRRRHSRSAARSRGPARTRRCAGAAVMSPPSKRTRPANFGTRPAIALIERRLAGAVRSEDARRSRPRATSNADARARSARPARSRRRAPRPRSTPSRSRRARRDRRR